MVLANFTRYVASVSAFRSDLHNKRVFWLVQVDAPFGNRTLSVDPDDLPPPGEPAEVVRKAIVPQVPPRVFIAKYNGISFTVGLTSLNHPQKRRWKKYQYIRIWTTAKFSSHPPPPPAPGSTAGPIAHHPGRGGSCGYRGTGEGLALAPGLSRLSPKQRIGLCDVCWHPRLWCGLAIRQNHVKWNSHRLPLSWGGLTKHPKQMMAWIDLLCLCLTSRRSRGLTAENRIPCPSVCRHRSRHLPSLLPSMGALQWFSRVPSLFSRLIWPF